jgi:RNA polymerase sigma-54 factor
MALEPRLDIRLAQKLALTPQLQQAIKLLQLPQLELSQALNQELSENPLLEEINEEDTAEERTEGEAENPDSLLDDEALLPLEKMMTFSRVDDYFEERGSDGRDLGYFSSGTETPPSFEHFLSSSSNLYDHLNGQLRLTSSDKELLDIAEVIIGNINDNGYLSISEEELTNLCKASQMSVQEAINLIQTLDPPGIGARNLKECLLLQIKALGLEGTLIEKIVQHNLQDLEKKNYQSVAKFHKAAYEDVMIAVNIIGELDPKPARNFSSHETNYITPDVSVELTDDGYKITLNDEGIPKLRLNNYYRKLLMRKDQLSKEEKKFLTEKLRSALWFIKSLDQRNRTIYKVTESILHFQMDFFEYGSQHIKPLNLRDIAVDINMHESTVSRVTLNKHLTCAHGIFGFRFFFSSALQSDKGDVSSTIVKNKIKSIVSDEDARKPYSDQKIADLLRNQDIKIARRTVAKYREELKIPAHTRRRRVEI